MSGRTPARDEILGRVRSALAGVEPTHEPVLAPSAVHDPMPTHEQVVDLFAERVADYRAVVDRVAAADLPGHLAGLFAPTERVVVPPGLDGDLLAAVPTPVADAHPTGSGLTAADLDATDAVLTTATVGIAETGTIVLDAQRHQRHRAHPRRGRPRPTDAARRPGGVIPRTPARGRGDGGTLPALIP